MLLQEKTVFDLDLWVTRNAAQFSQHHVTYSVTKFEVATSNDLRGDKFTRNVTVARTHGRNKYRYSLDLAFFLKKKLI